MDRNQSGNVNGLLNLSQSSANITKNDENACNPPLNLTRDTSKQGMKYYPEKILRTTEAYNINKSYDKLPEFLNKSVILQNQNLSQYKRQYKHQASPKPM